jgi:hypothetical protein
MSIPNSLTIILETSIPGYQNIKFKPSMIIPNNESKTVYFNPLQKLNKDVINKVPENIRVSEFFDKNLFNSLNNFHGIHKSLTLKEATEEGYIDNNISATLNTLFNKNNLIYLGGKPYTIFDFIWKEGDWNIDIKSYTTLKSEDTVNPILHNTLVKEEINAGNEELKELPEEVKVGPNHKLSSSDLIKPEPKPQESTTQESITTQEPIVSTVKQQESTSQEPIVNQVQQEEAHLPQPIIHEQQTLDTENNEVVSYINNNSNQEIVPIEKTNEVKSAVYPQLMDSTHVYKSDIILNKDELNIIDEPLVSDIKDVNTVRKYFKKTNYIYLLNKIFQNMYPNNKNVVRKYLKQTTEIQKSINTQNVDNSKNLSFSQYTISVNGLHVYKNNDNGNGLFSSIAQGINEYNKNEKNINKISYSTSNQNIEIFSQSIIRKIVATSFVNNVNLNDILKKIQNKLDDLNSKFSESLNSFVGTVSEEEYMNILNIVYNNSDNFLIKKPISMPTNPIIFEKPFTILSDSDEIKKYIETEKYNINEIIYNIIERELKLTIISVKNYLQNFSVPYVNLQINNITSDNKYLFLYFKDDHYKLMGFDFWLRSTPEDLQFNTIYIFEMRENNNNFIPPLYMLFLLYGSYYFNLTNENKEKVNLLRVFLNVIDVSFEKIIKTSTRNIIENKEKIKFIKLFNQMFPSNKSKEYLNIINNTSNETDFEKINKPLTITNVNEENHVGGKSSKKESNLSYYITVELSLYPGTSIPKDKESDLKCNLKWNEVRKSYAELTKQKYRIQPDYRSIETKQKGGKKTLKFINRKSGRKTLRK